MQIKFDISVIFSNNLPRFSIIVVHMSTDLSYKEEIISQKILFLVKCPAVKVNFLIRFL